MSHKILVQYMNLTPGYINQYSDKYHEKMYKFLLGEALTPHGEPLTYSDIIITIVTRAEQAYLDKKGPHTSKKNREHSYSIFLPSNISSGREYINSVAFGLSKVFVDFNTDKFIECCEIGRPLT